MTPNQRASNEHLSEAPPSSHVDTIVHVSILLVLATLFSLIGARHYLLFHTLIELVVVAVSWSVFFLTWNTRHFTITNAFVILGVAYACVGAIDLLHVLAYKGMTLFPGDGINMPIQLGVAARMVEATALVAFPFCLTRRIPIIGGILVAVGLAGTLLIAILSGHFPLCFAPHTGMTLFKKGCNVVSITLMTASATMLWVRRLNLDNRVAMTLFASIVSTIGAEFSFAVFDYSHVQTNILGHQLKFVSFYLLYLSLIVEGFNRPLETIARGLRIKDEKYHRIIEASIDGFCIADNHGRILEANETMAAMNGYRLDELIGMKMEDIDTISTPEGVRANIERVRKKGANRFEAQHQRKDGTIFDVEVSATYLDYEDGTFFVFERDISGRKYQEAQVKWQASLLNKVSDAIVSMDRKGRITYWNDAAQRIYGWSKNETLGQDIQELQQTRWVKEDRSTALATLEASGNWYGEVCKRARDGRFVWVELALSAITDDGGHCIGSVAIHRDVTQRHAVEQALKQSEYRYRTIVETAQEGIWILDPEGNTAFANQKMGDMLGIDPEAMIGRSFMDFMEESYVELAQTYFERRRQGIREHHDFCFRRQDGQPIWTIVSTNPIMDENGTLTSVLGMLIDITDRKQMEFSLLKSQARYNAIVDEQMEMVCRFLPDCTISFVNRSFCNIFSRTDAELTGMNLQRILPSMVNNFIHRSAEIHPRSRKLNTYEGEFICADGKMHWIEWNCQTITDDEGINIEYQAVGRDVTERKHLEQRLAEASIRERKTLAQELHDGLCQDLKSIEIDLSLLERQLTTAESTAITAALGGKVNQAVKTAYSIARGMLPAGLNAEGVGDAIRVLIDSLRYRAEAAIRMHIDETVRLPAGVDTNHVYCIAQEALNNAVLHSGASVIEVYWQKDGMCLTLRVKDNGVGIDTPGEGRKTQGMGMAVMRYRAQAIGADLTIDPCREGGTQVQLSIQIEPSRITFSNIPTNGYQ